MLVCVRGGECDLSRELVFHAPLCVKHCVFTAGLLFALFLLFPMLGKRSTGSFSERSPLKCVPEPFRRTFEAECVFSEVLEKLGC